MLATIAKLALTEEDPQNSRLTRVECAYRNTTVKLDRALMRLALLVPTLMQKACSLKLSVLLAKMDFIVKQLA